MPTNTPNHGYQLFGQHEAGWEHRTDFEKLDTEVEIRDTDANKSNYNPKAGAQFRATDTGAVYRGDGTSWVKADLDVATADVGTLRTKTAPRVDVTAYGAVGDGVTNDTAAIQNAINASSSGDVIYFPTGRYYVTSPIKVPNTRRLQGESSFEDNNSELTTDQAIAVVETENYGTENKQNICLDGLSIDGQNVATHGFRGDCSFTTIQRCEMRALAGNGITITKETTTIPLLNHYRWNSLRSDGLAGGTGIFEGFGVADNVMFGNYIDKFKDHGILARGWNTSISENHLHDNGHGIKSEAARTQRIISNHVGNNDKAAIRILNGAGSGEADIIIMANVFRNSNQNGATLGIIDIDGVNLAGILVIGNTGYRDDGASTTNNFVYSNAGAIEDLGIWMNVADDTHVLYDFCNVPTDAELNRFHGPIDANGFAIQNPDQVQGQTIKSTAPASPAPGDWYIDSGMNTTSGNLAIRVFDGTVWVDQN